MASGPCGWRGALQSRPYTLRLPERPCTQALPPTWKPYAHALRPPGGPTHKPSSHLRSHQRPSTYLEALRVLPRALQRRQLSHERVGAGRQRQPGVLGPRRQARRAARQALRGGRGLGAERCAHLALALLRGNEIMIRVRVWRGLVDCRVRASGAFPILCTANARGGLARCSALGAPARRCAARGTGAAAQHTAATAAVPAALLSRAAQPQDAPARTRRRS